VPHRQTHRRPHDRHRLRVEQPGEAQHCRS
jgi:hypothetical protein